MPTGTVLSASKRDLETADGYGEDALGESPCTQLASLTDACRPGGYKWVLTEIDTDSGLSFSYPVVDAKAQRTTKEPEQKVLH